MKIIINADDFGINEIVTSSIERLIEQRSITSTTVMANGKSLDEVKLFAQNHPEASFGVHLCLSEFESLTKSGILYKNGLIDNSGFFIKRAIFNINFFDCELMAAIKEELSAQIEKLLSFGIPISHADSHHHVHTIHALTPLFIETLKSFDIKKIRRGFDFDTLRQRRHLLLWLKQVKMNKTIEREFLTTDKFLSFKDGLPIIDEADKTIELMCHPGHPDKSYRDEIELLRNNINIIRNKHQLISYYDL